jgi:hypothetical protein
MSASITACSPGITGFLLGREYGRKGFNTLGVDGGFTTNDIMTTIMTTFIIIITNININIIIIITECVIGGRAEFFRLFKQRSARINCLTHEQVGIVDSPL